MISKELLREVLIEQQKRIRAQKSQNFVEREKLHEIKNFVKTNHAVIITGVRRCGKSVFLSQIANTFFDSYYYVNFEDERLADFDLNDFNRLYEICLEHFGKSKTFFLDEVQNIAGWERWVRRMRDDGFKFFITGSNARLLSKELATLLTGRHLQFSIFPFSFKEFLKLRGFDLQKNDIYITERRALIQKYFSEYVKKGGFPEYLKDNRIEILQEYFNDIVQRDIVERYSIKNIKQLKELAKYLITNTANLTTYNQLKKITGIKSVNTAIKYFSYLENAYLLLSEKYFSYSLKRQISNPFKVFAIDHGLRGAISFKFSRDFGRIFETIVAIELKRRNKEIYYWKNLLKEEVDFVVKGNNAKELMQVSYDVSDIRTRERETKILVKAGKELKCKNLLVITEDYEAQEKRSSKRIKFIPLWKWLLT